MQQGGWHGEASSHLSGNTCRYRLYVFRRKLRKRNDNGPCGHVYISYDAENFDWVRTVLVERLENHHGLDTIIDQRDFIGGAALTEAIVEAVDNSRKTILVVSTAYIQNSWCELELQMSLARGYHTVIPVMLGTVPIADMSRTLRKYITVRGYIKWTEQERGQQLFWKLLIDAIMDKENNIDLHDANQEPLL
ncbi:toll-like receptor 2 type-2 isoform X2 [Lingula anatina]|uniref:Toll-like receptor 2 type-2 isoform X2 n=1 Tax=Lingula anatina TaxID=7574 RepID=A0A1S3H1D6_LINAN|nr:toll-like receptor 2 type-2 isoform X2 [Lingula anatina]|eukprot:XP_013379752.1 toll-like receptor 2 type-2 isoform X2 [Lingula anatina]